MSVTPSPAPTETTGPVYADVAAVESFIEGWVTEDVEALERLLERAERDIDTLLGSYVRDPTTNLKLTPATLPTYQAAALSRATCAQAEYRFAMGEQFFVQSQYSFVSGPDFQRRGELPRVGPKVLGELADCGLKLAVPIAS